MSTSNRLDGLVEGALSNLKKSIASQPWSNPLLWALGLGFVATIGTAHKPTDWRQFIPTMSSAFLVASAALACGALLGFIFAIPRSNRTESMTAGGPLGLRPASRTNTNLEEISDWITKIVIAIGLAQLAEIPSTFRRLAAWVVDAFGKESVVTESLAGAIIVYFFILGFLIVYLWTRLYLSGMFDRADVRAQQTPAFLEGLIQALLYQPPPEGFRQAIELSDEYFNKFDKENWRIWRSRACAFGQQFASMDLNEQLLPPGMLVREQALTAVKRVLEINPGERESIRALWDRPHATKQEDDLAIFFDDSDFKKLLG
jgi:hypothetical protein